MKKINDRYAFQFASYMENKYNFTITDIGDLSWMNKALYRKIRLDKVRAITLGQVVYVRDWIGLSPNSRVVLCCHELRHIQQIQHLSAWRFYRNYADNIDARTSMETEAYKRSVESSLLLRGPDKTENKVYDYAEYMGSIYRGTKLHESAAREILSEHLDSLIALQTPNVCERMMDDFERSR